jgi:hypothetical protein
MEEESWGNLDYLAETTVSIISQPLREGENTDFGPLAYRRTKRTKREFLLRRIR